MCTVTARPGERVREVLLRLKGDETYESLAEKTGIPLGTLKHIGSGRSASPDVRSLNKIAMALTASLEEHQELLQAAGYGVVDGKAADTPTTDVHDRLSQLEDRFSRLEAQVAQLARRRGAK